MVMTAGNNVLMYARTVECFTDLTGDNSERLIGLKTLVYFKYISVPLFYS